MADIFFSYSKKDVERIQPLIAFAESMGYTVWWDKSIIAGDSWSATIEEELLKASSVIVVWSENSVKSEWVQIEAGKAKEKKSYVPVIIDDVVSKLPLEFTRIEVASFVGFYDESDAAEKDVLLAALKRNKNKGSNTPVEINTKAPFTDDYNKRRFWQKWQTKITIAAALLGVMLTLFNTVASCKKEVSIVTQPATEEVNTVEFMYLTLANNDGEMPDTIVTDPRIKLFLNYPKVSNELISLSDSLHISTDSFPLKTTFLKIENKGLSSLSDVELKVKEVFINDTVLIVEKAGNASADYEEALKRKTYKTEQQAFTLPASLEPSSGVLVPLFEIIKQKPGSANWAFTSRNISLPDSLFYKNASGKKISIKVRKMVTPITYKGGVEGRG